ncbi:MAG TPA: LysM peptidoglycan-binding domain-containing protein [Novosphingobium sp.]
MVAIVGGASFGLGQTSAKTLGSQGLLGNPSASYLGSNFFVNASTGNLILQNQDEILQGIGQDTILTRTYNSLGTFDDDNGDNWRTSSQRVVGNLAGTLNTSGSTVTRTDWDGSRQVFAYDATKSAYVFKDPTDSFDILTYNSSAQQWTWIDGSSRVIEVYDNLNGGRIISSLDSDGKGQTFTYTNTQLTRITNSDGGYVTLVWTGSNLTQLISYKSDGTLLVGRIRYTYDSSNRLTRATLDLSPEDNDITNNNTILYMYTYEGTSKRVATISESGSSSMVAFLYDSTTKKITRVTETAASGDVRITNFDYSVANRTRVTDAQGNVTDYFWDNEGRLTSVIYPGNQTTSYTWDSNTSRIASITDALGNTISYSYDANGNQTRVVDAIGNQVDRFYDSATNALLAETQYLLPDPDGTGPGLASNPITTRYVYDAQNHRRFSISPEGQVEEYLYDTTSGNTWKLASIISYTTHLYDVSSLATNASPSESAMAGWVAGLADKSSVQRTDLTYDFRGNLSTTTEFTSADSSGVGLISSAYTVTTYVYDQFGLLLSRQISGRTGSEVFTYDGLGRMLSSTDFANNKTRIAFDKNNRRMVVTLTNGETITTSFNAFGQAIDKTNAGSGSASQVETYKYDSLGQLKTAVDAFLKKDYTFYDTAGRKIGYVDRLGNLTEFRYDAGNRLVATIEYATTISPTSLFDVNGNPNNVALSSVRPTSIATDRWTWSIYDDANRLIGTIASDGAVTQYTYDGAGQLIKTTSFVNRLSASTVNGYKITQPATLTPPPASANDRTTRNFYDKAGQKIGALDSVGGLTRTVYDAAGRAVETIQYASLTTQSLRATGTWAQLLASVTASPNAADRHQYFAYDGQGNLRFTLDGKLNPTELIYNNSGDLIRSVAYGAPIAATSNYTSTYIQGQITALNLATGPAARTNRTTYDNAGRKAFEINAQGFVTAYTYNTLNLVVKVTQYATAFTASGDQTLSAMQNWGMANTRVNDRITRQVYDGLGRVAYEVNAEGYVTEYQYNLRNQVVKDIRYPTAYTSSQITNSVTQASMITLLGSVPADAITTLYEYDDNGNRTRITDGENFSTAYAFDTFGRNTDITDLTTNIVTHMDYDALDRVVQTTTAYGTAEALVVKSEYDGAGNLTGSTDARNNKTLFAFDVLGNKLTTSVPISVNPSTSAIAYAITVNEYDAFGNITKSTDPLLGQKFYEYDSLNNIKRKKVPLYLDGSLNVVYATTDYQYDAFGNMVAAVDPRLNTTFYYYDKLDRLRYEVDAEGYATETTYSIGGAVATVRRMATKPSGTGSTTALPAFTTNNAIDGLTSFTLDKLDRVKQVIDAEGFYEDYTLDAFGNRTVVRNKLGYNTLNEFDKRGLLRQETLPVTSLRSDGTAISVVNRFEYDSNGNRTKMIEAFGLPEQRTTIYEYDKNSRLKSKAGDTLSVLNPDTMVTASVPILEQYRYDENGNLTEVRDALGNRTLSYYDLANRKIAEINPRGTLSTWAYDLNGNMKSARVYGDLIPLPGTPGGMPPAIAGNNYRETLYDYDLGNRQIKSTLVGIETGRHANGSYTTSILPIIKENKYDAVGNIIVQIDGNLGSIYSFYDKNGKKTGQIDQAGYVTKWAYDHEGNVLQEKRFANKNINAIVAGGTLTFPAADGENDRVTDFTYDRNGRRKTESRQNVRIGVVSGGEIGSEPLVTATITYTYNGLGLVTSKQEATGDTTSYGYDAIGRQTTITGQSYTDYNGSVVSNQQAITYDGLNNAIKSVENGARTTTYTYGAGGRLLSSTDAAGNTTKYFYDATGHVTATSYRLVKADNSFRYVAQVLKYDAAGQQASQKTFTSTDEVNWTQSGDMTDYFYNAYGEVIARGTNTNGNQANAQEFNEYDKAGRLWRTNFNDGVTKAYMYDANGNATLLMQSFGSMDLRAAFTDINGMFASAAVSKTFSVFDARNQLVKTIQSDSNNAGASPVKAEQVTTPGTPVSFNSDASVNPANRSQTGAVAQIPGGNNVFTTASGYISISTEPGYYGGINYIHIDRGNVPQNGGQNVYVVVEKDWYVTASFSGGVFFPPDYGTYSEVFGAYSPDNSSIHIGNLADRTAGYYTYFRITVYQDAPGGIGRLKLAQTQISTTQLPDGTVTMTGSLNGSTWFAPQIQIGNEHSSTSVIRVFGRAQGSTGPYSYIGNASPMLREDGSAVAGWFSINGDAAGLQWQNWDLRYYALDAAGNLLDAKNASYAPGYAGYSQSSMGINGPGQVMATWDGPYYTLLFTGTSANAQSMRVFYRLAGTNNAFSQLPVNTTPRGGAYGQAGWWSGRPPADGQSYEFWVEQLDANGAIIGDRSYGTFVGGNGNPPSNLTQFTATIPMVTFSPPPDAVVTHQRMRYSTNGGATWSGWTPYNAGGAWSYNASGLAPDFYTNYNYTLEYETYNGTDMVSRATGNMTLGYAGQSIHLANVYSVPAKVVFNPVQTTGSTLKLFYRPSNSTGAYTAVTLTKANNKYAWDVDNPPIRPTSGFLLLDYYYDLYDSNGNLLPNLMGSDHVEGTLTIYSDRFVNTANAEIHWAIDTEAAAAGNFLISRSQTHNAFGEIDSETDGRNKTTNLYYNTEGKLIKKVSPQVEVTGENGVTSLANPTEYYYYDKSGRQIAQRDANGNLTTQTLLAGTGYGGSKALVTAEYRPGSTTTFGYDAYGDQRKKTEAGSVTTMVYDANHNLTEVYRPVRSGGNSPGTQLVDYYAYDALGQRIKHWNSQLGAAVLETTDYDVMGRVTRTVSMAGQTADYTYSYLGAGAGGINTAGLGSFGGWQKVTATSAGVSQTEQSDIFGHTTWRSDFGGHAYNYTYDKAGRLTKQTNTAGQDIDFAYYENGYVKSVRDNTLKMESTFEYDSEGNRTKETYNGFGSNPVFYQNAAITYDAMNRISRFLDAKADITYKYDAVGNRRNVKSVYQNGIGTGLQEQDYWYKYDGQNRFVTTMGELSGGSIVLGADGVAITYDAAGNRATATYGYDGHTETYTYTADGYLENMVIGGVVRARRTNDALGRVTSYKEYNASGVETLNRTASFDNDNRITADTTVASTTTTVTNYHYRAWNGSAYAGADQGVLVHTDQLESGITKNTNYYYTWWDEAKQSSIRIDATNPANANTGQWAPGLSDLSYDANGHITTLVDRTAVGGAKTVQYRNDAYGQILVREETQNGVIGPRQLYYYFNGMRVGDVGNNGEAQNRVDYAQQLAARGQARQTGLFRYGRPVASADFDQNYQPINAGYPGLAASAYTVRSGDTLRSIAQAMWGDGAMWYLIADANGLSAASQLSAGQRLIIPNKVTNLHNNSGTFRVYDPGEAIGDTLPTLPNEPAPPPAHKKGGGCGGIGAILMMVVAVVVTIVALPAGAPTVMQSLLAGTAGAVAGQATGLATGTIKKFDFKAVALGAISGMVTAGIGQLGKLAATGEIAGGLGKAATFLNGSGVASNIVRGALSSAVTQGVGVATGLQDRFDWGGVAAAGVNAAVGHWAGSQLGLSGPGATVVSGIAGGLAASAAESLVTGRNFGDTLMSNLPGIIGNTIGNIVADGITRGGKPANLLKGTPYDRFNESASNVANLTTGAGDGTATQPTVGLGGGRVGGSASSDVIGDEIVVRADPHERDMLWAMNDYQWGRYLGRAGPQRYSEGTALWALGLQQPYSGVTASFGAVSSYDSPLIQSLKTARPYGLYSDAPAQQYMLGDGSVFTGTPSALGRFQQQRAAQANMAYMDRLTGSTFGGIALGVSNALGRSPATQLKDYELAVGLDGLTMAFGGVRGAAIPGNNSQTSLSVVNGENGVHGNSRLSGRTTYLYELQTKDGQFLKYGISVNPDTRYSNSFMKDKDIFRITSGTRADMMAIERQMVISNPGPLNKEPWAIKARRGN